MLGHPSETDLALLGKWEPKALEFVAAQVCVGCQKITCILLRVLSYVYSLTLHTSRAAGQVGAQGVYVCRRADMCRVSENHVCILLRSILCIYSHTLKALVFVAAQGDLL